VEEINEMESGNAKGFISHQKVRFFFTRISQECSVMQKERYMKRMSLINWPITTPITFECSTKTEVISSNEKSASSKYRPIRALVGKWAVTERYMFHTGQLTYS